jgi:hypothetical protein
MMNGNFGLWRFKRDHDSFLEDLVWRLDLSADPDQAKATLTQADASLAGIREALSTAEGRMTAFLRTLPKRGDGGLQPAHGNLPRPTRTLLALLAWVRTEESPAGVSFENGPAENWRKAVDDFQAFIAGVQASISKDSRVETWIEGQLIAQTRLNRLENLQTIWLEKTSEAHRTIHQQSLQAALAGQLLMLETLTVNTHIARQLSSLIDNAADKIVALPLTFQFIINLRTERQP